MLNQIVKFFKVLNSNRNPSEIANAFCMGVMLGFMPKDNALWFLIFVFFFFVRMNKPAYLIVIAVVSQFAWLLDPLFNSLGYRILTVPQFSGFLGWLLDIPFVGFTKFNNTIVTGSFAISLLLYIPLFMLLRCFILLWRKKISPKLGDSALMKAFSKAPVIKKIIDIASEKM